MGTMTTLMGLETATGVIPKEGHMRTESGPTIYQTFRIALEEPAKISKYREPIMEMDINLSQDQCMGITPSTSQRMPTISLALDLNWIWKSAPTKKKMERRELECHQTNFEELEYYLVFHFSKLR